MISIPKLLYDYSLSSGFLSTNYNFKEKATNSPTNAPLNSQVIVGSLYQMLPPPLLNQVCKHDCRLYKNAHFIVLYSTCHIVY